MNYSYVLGGIAVMALVTYLPRMAPLVFFPQKDHQPHGALGALLHAVRRGWRR